MHTKLENKRAPGSNWFSYVMNNYWHTNYKSDQQGLSGYNYALRPHGAVNNTDMEKAAIAFATIAGHSIETGSDPFQEVCLN